MHVLCTMYNVLANRSVVNVYYTHENGCIYAAEKSYLCKFLSTGNTYLSELRTHFNKLAYKRRMNV
jgi:hypothetical protein